MAFILGIDPGTSGAMAVYDTDTRRLVGEVVDIPIWWQTVGKRKRKRVDALGIADLFETYGMMGVDLVIMEAVGGRKDQNTAHAFTFGYGVGILYMACFYSGMIIETVPPQTWKQLLRVPGKSKADDSAIVQRAEELFPEDRGAFRGPKNGIKLDRAEAAMIAKYGGDFIVNNIQPQSDVEAKLAYRRVDTGA